MEWVFLKSFFVEGGEVVLRRPGFFILFVCRFFFAWWVRLADCGVRFGFFCLFW